MGFFGYCLVRVKLLKSGGNRDAARLSGHIRGERPGPGRPPGGEADVPRAGGTGPGGPMPVSRDAPAVKCRGYSAPGESAAPGAAGSGSGPSGDAPLTAGMARVLALRAGRDNSAIPVACFRRPPGHAHLKSRRARRKRNSRPGPSMRPRQLLPLPHERFCNRCRQSRGLTRAGRTVGERFLHRYLRRPFINP